MKMLYDHVLIKDLKSKNPVMIADRQAKIPNKGEVVAVGPGDAYGYPALIPTTVKVGDRVYFSKDRAIETELKTGTFYVVKERDILGVLDKNEVA